MARILYAASGDGYGHAVRTHSVGDALMQRGHDVRFLSSYKTNDYLRAYYPDRIEEVFGLFTIYNQGKVEPYQTLLYNFRRAVTDLAPFNENVRRLMKTFRPDLLITDFEPFSAFWARRLGIPFISLDNQHLLTHCKVDHPKGFKRDILNAFLIIRLYYAGAKRYLITSFFDAPIRYHPTTIVAPILRPKVYAATPRDGDFVLVYKGAGGENDAMRDALLNYGRVEFQAYGFGLEGKQGHVTFKKTHADEFLNDLSQCKAVVSTAGHSLVCEAIHLRKPMLLIPMKQQYEQVLNAHQVEKLGYGESHDQLTRDGFDTFLSRVDDYRIRLASLPQRGIGSVIDAVEKEIP